MSSKTLIWGIFAAVLLGVSGAFAFKLLKATPTSPDLPVLGTLPEFSLVDQSGAPVTRGSFQNKSWVANFIYTRCPGQCPLLSQRMERLQALLPKESSLQLVSISVDPEHDKPAVLAQYAKQYHAQPERWHFLTGDSDAIGRLMQQGFKLPYDGTMIHHSEKLVLVDGHGQIRGYYDALDEQDLQRLIKEISREGITL